jgi:hypothetical protein
MPIETLVGDKGYAYPVFCRELEDDFGIHPHFAPRAHKDPALTTSKRVIVETLDGLPK